MTLHLRPILHDIEFVPPQRAGMIIKGKFYKCHSGAVLIMQNLFAKQGAFVSPAEISKVTHIKPANVSPYLYLGRQFLADHCGLFIYYHKTLGYMMQQKAAK